MWRPSRPSEEAPIGEGLLPEVQEVDDGLPLNVSDGGPALITLDDAANWMASLLQRGAFEEKRHLRVLRRWSRFPVMLNRIPFGSNPTLQAVHDVMRRNYETVSHEDSTGSITKQARLHRIPMLGLMCTKTDFQLMLNLIHSLDVVVESYVIIVNGEGDLAKVYALAMSRLYPKFVFATLHDMNEGVSRGWNIALRQAFVRSDPPKVSCVIANSDIEFPRGRLAPALAEFHSHPTMLLAQLHVFAFFGVKLQAFQLLGYSDEVLYPAYSEDIDLYLRMVAVGLRDSIGTFELGSVHYNSPNMKHQEAVRSMVKRLDRHDYIEKKWGVDAERFDIEKPFSNPFNNPSIGVHGWIVDPAHRRCLIEATHRNCPYNYSLVAVLAEQARRDDF